MEYRPLGNTSLNVSALCLGTMTWGEQNSEAEGFAQMDYALERGINFFDTAELYSVPPRAETYGATETIIGNWFRQRGNRDKVILASKVTGRQENYGQVSYMRPMPIRLDALNIRTALENSLRRLQTDYIDLYQLHWPDRPANFFGRLDYEHEETDNIPLAETLRVLQDCVKEGKIRHIGLSNETPWGVLECLRQHEQHGLPRVQSIQNPYNLLNRSFEIGLAEIAIREKVGLLAYSPLAFGMLSGKYLDGKKPDKARLTMFSRFQRYTGNRSQQATAAYVKLAQQHSLNPSQMALQFVTQQPFVTSNIIGATTLEQLKENIDSLDTVLSPEVREGINAIHNQNPNPAP